MENIVLHIPVTSPQLYQISTAMQIQLGTYTVKMIEDVEVEFSYLLNANKDPVVKMKVKNISFDNSHPDFFSFTSLINSLLNEILALPDQEGKCIDVVIPHWEEKWAELERKLSKSYEDKELVKQTAEQIRRFINDKGRLVRQLNNSGFHQLFFAGYYKDYSMPVKENQVFDTLILGVDLFIKKEWEATAIPDTNAKLVKVTGEVDPEKFDRKSYTRNVKELVNQYDLKIDYSFDYEESYVFDIHDVLQEAETYLSFIESPIYSYTVARSLKNISPDNHFSFVLPALENTIKD
ncbi:MAG: hypothetical protein MUW56_18940 [Chryseobacterium sp.]|uniref:hypothetical protein n=1 Tax=Chryseobacterium sp. TaxID=1871047 RepID=UPI0025C49962|nr:hypothetical protein [Chryseobacterium sp.]MCJ7935639.1 hypothetical protein [Chryseobacterium sp.]